MSKNTWFQGLNPQQQEAVGHDYGPLLILAGAGSGKTTVLVSRTGRLIEEKIAKPDEVLVLTFTNKAARELKERVERKLGKIGRRLWAGTFHSFGLQILRENHKLADLPKRFAIIDSTDARGLVKDVLKDIVHAEKESFDVERILSLMALKREGRSYPADADPKDAEVTEMVLPRYLSQLKMWGAVDFDGLLIKPLELFDKNLDVLEQYQRRYQQVMVDEFQDTNRLQMRLVQQLVAQHKNISVVGDDDQSIYGWRGAVISNILNFPKSFQNCHVVRLETNYRSTGAILNVANSVIMKNSKRHKKTLVPASNDTMASLPEVFTYDTDEEEIEEVVSQIRHFKHQGFRLNEIAILFRSNSQGGLLEASLRTHNIPYSLSGGTGFFDRKEVRDTFAYIRSAVRPNDLSLRRILNTPARGIGKTSFDQLDQYTHEHSLSFFKALSSWEAAGLQPKIGVQVTKFLNLLAELKNLLSSSEAICYAQALPRFFIGVGYRDYVLSSYKDSSVAHRKWQLIEVMGRIIDGYIARSGRGLKTLGGFIDSMELRDQVDPEEGSNEEKLQLLTLHACKGLEFPVVIMMGNEEGLLPHETLGSDVDEERRLFYVGVTRAKKHLVLTHARKRKRYGSWRLSTPSRFLVDIPKNLLRFYENGVRPLKETDRKSLLDGLYAKLDQQMAEKET